MNSKTSALYFYGIAIAANEFAADTTSKQIHEVAARHKLAALFDINSKIWFLADEETLQIAEDISVRLEPAQLYNTANEHLAYDRLERFTEAFNISLRWKKPGWYLRLINQQYYRAKSLG